MPRLAANARPRPELRQVPAATLTVLKSTQAVVRGKLTLSSRQSTLDPRQPLTS
jgi:hypothetical protein